MKNLILLLLLMLPFLMFSQSNYSLDYMFSPDLTYRIQYYDGNEKFIADIKRRNDSAELSKFGSHFGVGFNIKLSSKFWLKLGLQMSNLGYRRLLANPQWGSQNNNGVFDPNLPPNLTATALNFYYGVYSINIPVVVRYELNEKKLAPYFELGLVPSYAVERYTKIVSENQQSKSLSESKNNFLLMLHWGFGVNYRLKEKWKIYGQPTIRYQLNSVSEPPIKEHLYSIGLELGARMSL